MYKQFIHSGFRLALAATALAALSACGTISNVDDAGKTDQPVFPEMSDASMPEGYYVNQDNLASIRAGMTKKQIMALIGHPQFNEGIIGVREWDYIFKFRQPEGPDKVCQYKVLFDKDVLAQSFFFSPSDCMTPAPQAPVVKNVDLSADAAFGFASATLSAQGRASLDQLANDIDLTQVDRIEVVGYTDRIGSRADNDALSTARAVAVRNYLLEKGIPQSLISAEGRGASEPLVNCPGAKSAQVIECLAPNRRTSITIHFI
ncbi:OmpA family protein [Pseudomonas segetis]|uniref:SmpA / OmlA family protein n=1 Tax=Pseudomonas segetis TaxID=298908 RepID=A0A239I632_9PSED|nr:OmpA family protein [Pseudomonas segetis]SNS88822.1 SmpA / OmlA family protein [Pseudomonas segetis]